MSNEIKTIVKWFSDAKPNPTIEEACVQIGCHYEEVAEMLTSFGDDEAHVMNYLANCYKTKERVYLACMPRTKDAKIELLDALCDQIVTAVGSAQYMGFDIIGALNEVIASNDSKRMPDGSFPLDENGKITKESPNFFRPDLSKFIGGNND